MIQTVPITLKRDSNHENYPGYRSCEPGKTSFIRNLIPVLKSYGSVGVIKHLGDHE